MYDVYIYCSEVGVTWDVEVRDDVIGECNKHGGVLHIYVDKASPQGNVYVKCPTITAAAASVNALHGRFFAGNYCTVCRYMHYAHAFQLCCCVFIMARLHVHIHKWRVFAGRVITAAYVPLPNYHQLFPDALRATALIMPSSKNFGAMGGASQLGAVQMPFVQR